MNIKEIKFSLRKHEWYESTENIFVNHHYLGMEVIIKKDTILLNHFDYNNIVEKTFEDINIEGLGKIINDYYNEVKNYYNPEEVSSE